MKTALPLLLAAALAGCAGGLAEEDGFLVYDVDLVHAGGPDGTPVEVDVVVDAGTGEVLCTELD